MKTRVFLFLVFMCISMQSVFSQGITPPSEGKAVVYIARVSGLGAAINFKYFIDDQFVGKANAGKYLRIECEPGEHLIWANSEKNDFVEADLEAGKIYIIEARPKMGGMKARVKMLPLDHTNEKLVAKTEKLLNKKAPFQNPEEKMSQMKAKLVDFIKESLDKYEAEKAEKEYAKMTSDMFYEAKK